MGKALAYPGDNAVHLCIDAQTLFARGPWAVPWLEATLPGIVALAEHASARTVFTRFIPPRTRDEARGAWRAYYAKWSEVTRDRLDPEVLDLVPALQRLTPPGEIIDRTVYSAFGGSRLHAFLSSRGVDSLVISGGETDVCVLSTTLSAIDLGYRVILVEDALCSSSDECHDALLHLYRTRFDMQVAVTTVQELLATWKVA